jgi:hypothetical protein
MPEADYPRDFPNLKTEGWARTSDPAPYNCIAFAVGDHARYWWPNIWHPEPADSYWPDGAPNAETHDAFVLAFATRGFVVCADGDPEVGFEKIVLYELNNEPMHAAVLMPNGKWRSKLGKHEDIETSLYGLAGPRYGAAALFMKRPMRQP